MLFYIHSSVGAIATEAFVGGASPAITLTLFLIRTRDAIFYARDVGSFVPSFCYWSYMGGGYAASAWWLSALDRHALVSKCYDRP